jgi:hypothetical protein
MPSEKSTITDVQDWLTEVLTEKQDEKACSHIALLHQVGQTREEILTKRFGSGDNTVERLARLLYGRAEVIAKALDGHQVFWLYAFYGGRTEEGNKLPFPIMGKIGDPEHGTELATYTPDARGQKMQDMNHNEHMFSLAMNATAQANRDTRLAAELVATVARNTMQTLVQVQEENRMARDRFMELFLENKLQEQNREIEMQKYARESVEREMFFKMLPALANTLTGHEIFPQGTVDTSIVEGIFTEMDPDTVKMLVGMVGQKNKELAAVIMDRFEKGMREKRMKAEAIANAVAETRTLPMNSEFDATGEDKH